MLRRFPHEFQLDAKDCGPACIKIIAKYYGKFYSLQFLRDLCGISKEGVNMLGISHACEKISLRTISAKLSLEELIKAPLPIIIHWNNNHFVVLYKIKLGYVFISDPAKGLIKYTKAEFIKYWLKSGLGTAMMIEPMSDFKQTQINDLKQRRKTLENLLGYFSPYKKAFINLFIVMFIVTVLQGLLPFISKSVIDIGIQTTDVNFIHLVLVANVTIIVSLLLCNLVRDWILLHITSRVNISLISGNHSGCL